jgi:DNA-binding NarL/FixJ family response regulator
MPTVVIVDDHPVVRAGLRTVLEQTRDIRVIAEGARGRVGRAPAHTARNRNPLLAGAGLR